MSLSSAEGIGVAESLGLQRVVLARELSLRRNPPDSQPDAAGPGGLRPRRAVHRRVGPVHGQPRPGRPQRQPRPVCPSLPAAVPIDLRRPPDGPGPAEVSAQSAGPGRLRPAAGTAGRRRGCLQDRGAAQVGRVCGRMSPGITARRSTPPARAAAPRVHAAADGRTGGLLLPRLLAPAGWKAATTRPWSPEKARPSRVSVWACFAASRRDARGSSWPRPSSAATASSSRATARMTFGRAAASTACFARAGRWTGRLPTGWWNSPSAAATSNSINCGPA